MGRVYSNRKIKKKRIKTKKKKTKRKKGKGRGRNVLTDENVRVGDGGKSDEGGEGWALGWAYIYL